jgi:hypothetical protein
MISRRKIGGIPPKPTQQARIFGTQQGSADMPQRHHQISSADKRTIGLALVLSTRGARPAAPSPPDGQ